MGRTFRDVAVVKAYDVEGSFVTEDIVPVASFHTSGSILLNCAQTRATKGVRFISFRVFDEQGNRTDDDRVSYDSRGTQVEGLHRRPDGSIIEDCDWV